MSVPQNSIRPQMEVLGEAAKKEGCCRLSGSLVVLYLVSLSSYILLLVVSSLGVVYIVLSGVL